MELDRDVAGRLAVGVVALALLAVAAYVVVSFVQIVVFAVFLYYTVRPVFHFLDRFNLPRNARAALALVSFGVPFLVLLAYTVAIIAIEVRDFLVEQELAAGARQQLIAELNVAALDLTSIETVLADLDSLPPMDAVADLLLGATGIAGAVFIQVLLILTAVYYMLVDGPRLVAWFLDTYDESGVLRAYVEAVDPELSATLFGNIVNVFVTAILATVTFYAYNLLVASSIAVPFPALIGALIGVGTLIPVVGIKLVYVPVVVGLAAKAWLAGDPGLLVPVAVLFAVTAVVLDFIPDIVIRARFSGDETHNGLLMLAYITGPTLFGFYGLFLAPILLILAIHAVTILVPYARSGAVPTTSEQTELSEFAE